MANAIYPLWKEALMAGTAGNFLVAGTVKVALIDTGVNAYDPAEQFYGTGAGTMGGATVGTPQVLGSKTVTGGVFDSTGLVTFPTVTGNQSEALVIYIDSGAVATSPLVCYLDTNVTGLPVTPNSGDITVDWNATGIFAL